MELKMAQRSTSEWFGIIGAAVGGFCAIAIASENGLFVALWSSLIGILVGGLAGMIAHWAIFQLPRDFAEWLRKSFEDAFEFVREYWIILAAVVLGLLMFVGTK
jgi:hypothetical protein